MPTKIRGFDRRRCRSRIVRLCGAWRRVRRIDRQKHAVHACGYGAVGIAGFHLRYDGVRDDPARVRVGQRAFQTVADFDPYLVILHEHEQHGAVIFSFLTDPPLLCGLRSPGLQRDVAGRLADVDHDVMSGRRLEGLELVFQRRSRGCTQGAGRIDDFGGRTRRYGKIRRENRDARERCEQNGENECGAEAPRNHARVSTEKCVRNCSPSRSTAWTIPSAIWSYAK